ncbi:antitermination NusB domain-containing protein [Tasmannia lanceolata]|uniref:antitermination NusB domain-containing protein n=1 Tax=Tasmannia lanceolata TaxID=3420 RepID=UPI0040635CEC
MEANSLLNLSCSNTHFPFHLLNSSSSSPLSQTISFHPNPLKKNNVRTNFKPKYSSFSPPKSLLLSPPFAVVESLEKISDSSFSPKEMSAKIDKSGRFSSPRAARELALLIAYAACLEGSDPIRLFDKRVNAKRDPDFVFDKAILLEYDHMSFGGPPVSTETEEEAEDLLLKNEKESANEAEVLSAPPKLVYNKFVLRSARNILEAVVDRWDQNILIINKIIPPNWKNEPAGRIIDLCILHLAMGEITVIGTRHQIVINEAVDLAKRFCDGTAPRIINGCLRTFVKDLHGMEMAQPSEAKS